MYKKYILFILFLSIDTNYNWANQNNISIEKNKINICGKFNGRNYEHILINNKTEITLYEKPFFPEGDPNLFQQTKSLIPSQNDITPSIKQIQYVQPEITPELIKKCLSLYRIINKIGMKLKLLFQTMKLIIIYYRHQIKLQ